MFHCTLLECKKLSQIDKSHIINAVFLQKRNIIRQSLQNFHTTSLQSSFLQYFVDYQYYTHLFCFISNGLFYCVEYKREPSLMTSHIWGRQGGPRLPQKRDVIEQDKVGRQVKNGKKPWDVINERSQTLSNLRWRFSQNFVAFSEYMNFNIHKN